MKNDGEEEEVTTVSNKEQLIIIANLKQYLSRVCPPILFSTSEKASVFEASLNNGVATEVLGKFSMSSELSLLVVELVDDHGSIATFLIVCVI
jgi:hypothetical protein